MKDIIDSEHLFLESTGIGICIVKSTQKKYQNCPNQSFNLDILI